MTYKLEPWLERITSSVFLFYPNGEYMLYKNGSELVRIAFDKSYHVREIRAGENIAEVYLIEDELYPID